MADVAETSCLKSWFGALTIGPLCCLVRHPFEKLIVSIQVFHADILCHIKYFGRRLFPCGVSFFSNPASDFSFLSILLEMKDL